MQNLPYEEEVYPTVFVNGDFEASYTPMANSGVRSDRAIYVPEGWTLDYSSRDENDLTAFKEGDLYYSQFFASKPQNSQGGGHTLWIRQRWNPSVLDYYQDVLLTAGKYTLSADLFASDNSTNNTASVYISGIHRTVTTTNQWQTVTIEFEANGTNPVTIGARANHKSGEFICAFDNFVITPSTPVNINTVTPSTESAPTTFDLTGRKTAVPAKNSVLVSRCRKLIVNKHE